MRFILGAATASLALATTMAHAAGGVYFSEYVEGSSNNKALEIYNGTDQPVDLGQYSVLIYFNGSNKAGSDIALQGMLASGKTYVLASSKADPAVLNKADQTYGGSFFNGNDAVVLSDNGSVADSIGQVGDDPGAEWGSGDVGTENHTLRRDTDVTTGRTDSTAPFDPSQQWQGYPEDTFADLGQYQSGSSASEVAFGACGDPSTAIDAIQGAGDASPLAGKQVVLQGVVTAAFPGEKGLDGFFVQTRDDNTDSNPQTSEGLFIYGLDANKTPSTGQLVRVRGTVSEYNGLTELDKVDGLSVCSSGHSVTPAQLRLPFTSVDAPEAYEGMAVTIRQRLTVSGTSDLGEYGELTLSAAGRLYQPTSVVPPGMPAQMLAKYNDRDQIVLDDDSGAADPEPIPYPSPQLTAYHTVRDGDTITDLQGVLTYRFGQWVVEPTRAPVIDPVNTRPDGSDLPSNGNLRIASANIENYFNGNGQGGGFPTARGATTYAQFQHQKAKVLAELSSLHADVIGLMEVENDGYGPNSAIQGLVDGLNASAPAGVHYAFVNPQMDHLGSDKIANDIIYNTNAVTEIGKPATLLESPFDYGNRPPLAATFRTSNGAEFTYVANHLRSKGGCPSSGPNAAQGDGQGCWNAQRTMAANETASWLATNPTGIPEADVVLMGDFNTYTREDPIKALENDGYVSLLTSRAGRHAYTYVYDAQAGALDHALVSPAMENDVTAIDPVHFNSDEPPVLHYDNDSDKESASEQSLLYAPTPYRTSDHDPLVVELQLPASATQASP